MDVERKRRSEAEDRRQDSGFTLIESIVAMGLFVGVVLLLVSVFNEFLLNDYSSKLDRAILIAENEIQRVEKSNVFESVDRDTIGFHITQTVTMRERVVLVDVAVSDAQPKVEGPMTQKKPQRQYIELTKAFPAR